MAEKNHGVLVRGLVSDGAVRMILVEGAELARITQATHGLNEGATLLVAEAQMAAALLSAHIKGEERLTVQIQGSNPNYGLYVEISSDGDVRARLSPSEITLGEDASALMHTQKSLGSKKLYEGITEVLGSTLEKPLAEHLRQSAQVDAILRLGVSIEKGEVVSCGGFLVERMPAAKGYTNISSEAFFAKYSWLSDAKIEDLLTGLAFSQLGEEKVTWLEKTPLHWKCSCSVSRIERTLSLIGRDILVELADEDHGAEVVCHFCNTAYQVSESRLRELAQSQPQSS